MPIYAICSRHRPRICDLRVDYRLCTSRVRHASTKPTSISHSPALQESSTVYKGLKAKSPSPKPSPTSYGPIAQPLLGAITGPSGGPKTVGVLSAAFLRSPTIKSRVSNRIEPPQPLGRPTGPGTKSRAGKIDTSTDYCISPGDSQAIKLPDGRQLGYAIYGSRSPKACVIVAFHGTPGSRLFFHDWSPWARRNDVTLVCPERPGYGLSTIKRHYDVVSHAQDVQTLMDFLGFKQYRVEGISGGGPYALALTHISTRSEVLATLLLAPGTPIEASRAGQSMQAYLRELFNYFPLVAEMRLDIKRRMFTESTAALQHTPTHKLRETAPGRKFIETCAEYATAAGYVHDYAAGDRHWGFELEDVDANRIVIFAGGLDESTPVDGMRYMRNRLRNAELVEYPNETHSSLQENHGYRARELLLKM